MFTSVHSAVAKLVVKLSARSIPPATTPVGLENLTQAYNPKFHKELVRRLQVINTRHTVLGRVQGVGLRALRKTKKPREKRALSTSTPVDTINEAFGIPHTVVIEALQTCSRVLPRTRVYTYWDMDPNAPDTTYDLYDADHEAEHESRNEVDATASTVSEDPSHDRSLHDVLAAMEGSEYEWRTSDTDSEATLDVVTDDDRTINYLEAESEDASNNPVADEGPFISTFDREDGLSLASTTNQCNFRTAPSPPSIFFCPPTSTSTLVTTEDESGSTLRYSPVLVHESESYEEALHSEFKAIIGDT